MNNRLIDGWQECIIADIGAGGKEFWESVNEEDPILSLKKKLNLSKVAANRRKFIDE